MGQKKSKMAVAKIKEKFFLKKRTSKKNFKKRRGLEKDSHSVQATTTPTYYFCRYRFRNALYMI